MRNVLNVDEELCTGCRICEMVCSLRKTGKFSPLKSGIWILRDDHRGITKPVVCLQCRGLPCEEVCPVKDEKPIIRDKKTDAVLILNEACIGCYECVRACPFGAIRIDPEDDKLVKCDLCGGDPECVKWCPTGAISFITTGMVGARKLGTALREVS